MNVSAPSDQYGKIMSVNRTYLKIETTVKDLIKQARTRPRKN
jgi:hypothetical protein